MIKINGDVRWSVGGGGGMLVYTQFLYILFPRHCICSTVHNFVSVINNIIIVTILNWYEGNTNSAHLCTLILWQTIGRRGVSSSSPCAVRAYSTGNAFSEELISSQFRLNSSPLVSGGTITVEFSCSRYRRIVLVSSPGHSHIFNVCV